MINVNGRAKLFLRKTLLVGAVFVAHVFLYNVINGNRVDPTHQAPRKTTNLLDVAITPVIIWSDMTRAPVIATMPPSKKKLLRAPVITNPITKRLTKNSASTEAESKLAITTVPLPVSRPASMSLSRPDDAAHPFSSEPPLISSEATRSALRSFMDTEKARPALPLHDSGQTSFTVQSRLERRIDSAGMERNLIREQRLSDGTRSAKVTGPFGTYCIEQNAQVLNGQDNDQKSKTRMTSCRE